MCGVVSGSLGQNCSVDLVVAGSDDENTVRTLARPRTMHTRRSPPSNTVGRSRAIQSPIQPIRYSSVTRDNTCDFPRLAGIYAIVFSIYAMAHLVLLMLESL